MKPPSSTQTWLMILLLVVAFAALLVFSGRRQEKATMPAFSTESPQPDGALALYRLFGKYGIRVERLYEDVYFFPPQAEVVAFPPGVWTHSMDVDALISWLQDGGRLIILNQDSYEVSEVFTATSAKPKQRQRHDATGVGGDSEAAPRRHADEVPVYPGEFGRSLNEAVLRQPREVALAAKSLYSEGVTTLSMPVVRSPILRGKKPTVTLGDGTALAVEMNVGKGKLVYMRVPEIASNQWVRRKDNARFIANLLVANQGDGPIYFSEYYLGNTKIYPSPLFYMATTPGGWALLLALSAALLFFLNLAVPFGRPSPEAVARRRRSEEVLDAQANLYRRSNASGIAAENLLSGLKLSVMRARHLPRVPSLSYVRAVFSMEYGTTPALPSYLDSLQDRRISHAELVSLAQEVSRLTGILKGERPAVRKA